MKESSKSLFYRLLFAGIFLLLILAMQPGEVYLFLKDISILFPKGIIGIKERDLLLLIQAVMLIFVIPVYIFTFLFSWWYRWDNEKSNYDPHLVDHKVAEMIWWGVPFILTCVVAVITWIKTYELDPYKPIESDRKPIEIEVVALQWRWLFIYPEEKIATINYIQIPKETPIHFRITADAPMNSFWIPDLGGQIYAMPGMETQLYLMANETGTFPGSSANISGHGFAGMTFETRATNDQEYESFIARAQQSDRTLDLAKYQQLAEPSKDRGTMIFQLGDQNLFNEIIMKFMHPQKELK